jgi:zinc transport system ATP-binding protein
MQSIIQLQNVTTGYDAKIALKDVSLNINARDFLGIIGPNGGGKTTLVKVILGLLKPKQGQVKYFREGKEVNEITMGYLPQHSEIDHTFPISVYDTILSGLSRQKSLLRPFTREQRGMVDEIVNQLQLNGLDKRHIGALSGGQLQRVLLARAIVSKPEVVILDEPNTYIDQQFQSQMYQILLDINRDCAIVMVSHNVKSILQNAKEVAYVNQILHYYSNTDISESELQQCSGHSAHNL